MTGKTRLPPRQSSPSGSSWDATVMMQKQCSLQERSPAGMDEALKACAKTKLSGESGAYAAW